MNCRAYKDKAIQQRNTWLKTLPAFLKYYHVIGEEKLTTPFVIDDKNHILFVKTKDDYNSLPHKVISAFMAIKETYQFKYIFKTDDDQVLTKPLFFNLLRDKLIGGKKKEHHYEPNDKHHYEPNDKLNDKHHYGPNDKLNDKHHYGPNDKLNDKHHYGPNDKHHYGGKIININTHKSTYFSKHKKLPSNIVLHECKYCNGRFYFLSHEAVNDLLKKQETIKKEYIEDYAIGYYLAPEFKSNMLYLNSNDVFKDMKTNVDNYKRMLLFHF